MLGDAVDMLEIGKGNVEADRGGAKGLLVLVRFKGLGPHAIGFFLLLNGIASGIL